MANTQHTQYGILVFDTTPPHAEVYIGNKLFGKTPSLKITDVTEGTYNYTIKKDKNTYNNEIYIQAGKIFHIHIDLITKEKQEKQEKSSSVSLLHNELQSPQPQTSLQQKDNNETLENINKNISELVNLIHNSNIVESKKSVPYNSVVTIQTATLTAPTNPDSYLNKEDVYAENDCKPIKNMQIINDGPGTIFFIQLSQGKQELSTQEEVLNVGDNRSLNNVYEIRLRADTPLTRYRLIEGELTGGSFARNYKNYVENRIVLQPNEVRLTLEVLFDNNINPIPITVPAVNNIPTDNSLYIRQAPLAVGAIATFFITLLNSPTPLSQIDLSGNLTTTNALIPTPMPFLIPTGFIAEAFNSSGNMSTNFTIRDLIELVPGTGVYTLLQTYPCSSRGTLFSIQSNLSVISTENLDSTGAPSPGRNFILTITNDDTVNTMIGWIGFEVILKKLS